MAPHYDNLLSRLPPTISQILNREGKVQNPPTIDFGGQTLQELAQGHQGVEKTGHHGGKDENRANSVEKYEKEKDTFEDLHKSILGCDDVLKSVELYLTSFQTDLGVVSAEIESLQSRSTALNQKLDNRKAVERVLGPMVEEFSISPAIVRKISEGTIDDAWIASLAELEHRSKTVETKAKEQPNTKAIEDAKPLLRNLISRALEVIRDYLVAQIKALRSPNINAQIIQRQSFLRYKALYAFLARHHPTLAEEIGQAYINTMRWYYLTHFTRYQKALEKMKIFVIEKQDVLGADESARKGNLLPSSKAALSAPDAFNLGRRLDLLKTTNETALASYLAEENKTTHHLEVPFRNFNLALVDNASAEFSFMAEFFAPDSFHRISRRFSDVFGPTFALGQALTRSLVEGTADGLGVLMCVRLNQRFAFELQRRRVPAVESYVNGTNMLLWPRFQMVMDLHCDSLRRATSSTPRGAASALSLSGPASTAQSAAPLPTTQRFAQLLQGILALSSEAGDDEPVSSSLGRLRNDFEAFLTKLSKAVGDSRRRERFLFNNYSLVLTIIEACHSISPWLLPP
ncbi:MAG: hypothetical protein M1825_004479 [Sarcosagium campestre]|nr:MAG: hypothetical protein M1825_004479 [Sarcosagium campestre]